jgi:hypothetical protein
VTLPTEALGTKGKRHKKSEDRSQKLRTPENSGGRDPAQRESKPKVPLHGGAGVGYLQRLKTKDRRLELKENKYHVC